MQQVLSAIGGLWSRGCLGKGLIILVGLFVLSCISAALGLNRGTPAAPPASAPLIIVAPTEAPTKAPAASRIRPTARPAPTEAPAPTTQPTARPAPTEAPAAAVAPTDSPTIAPVDKPTAGAAVVQPTEAPAAPVAQPKPASSTGGVAPQGSACPGDAPIKGNIRDRNPDKGAKIYHLPGDNGYAQTKPERCFATAADAEAAGFRPVKR